MTLWRQNNRKIVAQCQKNSKIQKGGPCIRAGFVSYVKIGRNNERGTLCTSIDAYLVAGLVVR